MNRAVAVILGAALSTAPLSHASAQIRASERAGVSQTIDGTKMDIDYSAPRARGRTVLFGTTGAVRWNEVWTPGANYATTLETNKPITLDGHAIPAGKYALWMTVRKNGAWTMMLDPDSHRFHEDRPDSTDKQIRFIVHPTVGPFEDVLAWRFSKPTATGATLSMLWGSTRVSMRVGVAPSMRMTTPADEAAPTLGTYEWKSFDRDSTVKYTATFAHEKGYLMGHLRPLESWLTDFALVRLKQDFYTFALFEKGEIVDVEVTWVLEFTRDKSGKVVSFEVRDDTDRLWVTGKKKP